MSKHILESLTLPGTLASLSSIGNYVMKVAAAAGIDKSAAYRLRLAVDEIATNCVVHGYDEGGLEGMLYLGGSIDDKALTVYVEDTAMPYDPRQTPAPDDLDVPLEEREIGGLGVFLALRGVDQFEYEYVNGRNRSIFIMNRTSDDKPIAG
jgi:serine/threonine-protein kinase RsbW